MSKSFKVRAVDSEDIRVIAAYLQDAVIPLVDMKFQQQESRFLLVANRFKWENCDDDLSLAAASLEDGAEDAEPCTRYERIECGVCFDGVTAVRRRGVSPAERERFLELLTIEPTGAGSALTAVDLVFADGAVVRLEGEGITCRVSDYGEAWPTTWRPSHPLEQKD